MEITFLGHASFLIKGKTGKVVIDPYSEEFTGFSFPDVQADIVAVTHQHEDHNAVENVKGEHIVIAGSGEYEIKGIRFFGIQTYHDEENGKKRGENTAYHLEIDRISVVHLGDLGHKLTDDQVEKLDGVDILMLPVGGIYTIDSKDAKEVVAQLEPSIIIPMHYKTPKHKKDVFASLADVGEFLKAMDQEDVVSQDKLLISKDKLPEEQTVILLDSLSN